MRVAVAGAGYFARFHHEAWSRLEGVTLSAIIDPDLERAKAAQMRSGAGAHGDDLAALLDRGGIDLVDIVTPPNTHHALVEIAATRGVDVVCQKPLAPSLAAALAIVELAERAGITLIVHENFRFQPWYREIRGLLKRGAIGDVLGAQFRLRPGDGRGPDAYLDRQPYFQQMPKFLVHETLIHLIDTFRYLFGEVEAVTARLRKLNPVIAGEDAGLVILEHAAGFETIIDGNRLSSHAAANPRLTMGELMIDGMTGVLQMNGEAAISMRQHTGPVAAHGYAWRDHGFGGDCVFALCQHVAHAKRTGGTFENTGRDYLRNMLIEEAVYQSHDEGRRIVL